jgi:hypothetical protein
VALAAIHVFAVKILRIAKLLCLLVYLIAGFNIVASLLSGTGFGGEFGPVGMSAPASICFVALSSAVYLVAKAVGPVYLDPR